MHGGRAEIINDSVQAMLGLAREERQERDGPGRGDDKDGDVRADERFKAPGRRDMHQAARRSSGSG